MSALKVWLPKNFFDLFSLPVTWREVVSVFSLGVLAKLLWQQYGVLRWPNRPPTYLGLPLLGHSLRLFRETEQGFGHRMLQGNKAVLVNLLGRNVVFVDWPLYMERLQRLEVDGGMTPDWPIKLLGPDSILSLPGGKGHTRHKRLRNKALASLGPKAMMGFLPEMLDIIRQTLDKMVEESESQGFTSFQPHAKTLAAQVSTLPITAGVEAKVQREICTLLDDAANGLVAVPVDLGRFSRCGRSLIAKRRIGELIADIAASPNLSRRNIVSDLVRASEDGEGLTGNEMTDTVATLLGAGEVTTTEVLQALVAQLHEWPDWVQRIAQEPLSFTGCEDDSATLQFVRETLRVQPPLGLYRRRLINSQPIDLGEHGTIPPGTSLSVFLAKELAGMADDFDPKRWAADEMRNQHALPFGGPQPHQCIGKNLALLELQVFARVLCAEYDFEAIDAELVVQAPYVALGYKDGLKVKISQKKA